MEVTVTVEVTLTAEIKVAVEVAVEEKVAVQVKLAVTVTVTVAVTVTYLSQELFERLFLVDRHLVRAVLLLREHALFYLLPELLKP